MIREMGYARLRIGWDGVRDVRRVGDVRRVHR